MARLRLLTATASGVTLIAVAAACGSGSSNALYSFAQPWGVSKHIDPVGQLWSVGGIPLCTKGSTPVTLASITPVTISGEIQLRQIVVRRVHWPKKSAPPGDVADAIGTYPGLVPAGHAPAGYVIPSPSPCNWSKRSDPVFETVVAATRTGPRGGYIDGLRVRYRVGSAHGEYVIPFTYAFCGRHGPAPCRQ